MRNPYDDRYSATGYYWGTLPSRSCYRVLELLPPDRPLKLLDIGCGEGRNAVFFARNGYHVTAFDTSPIGIVKTERMAAAAGVQIEAFEADINTFPLSEPYDILFSTGVLQYVPPETRDSLLANYRAHTSPNGLNVFSVFVEKPFIAPAPDAEQYFPSLDLWRDPDPLSRLAHRAHRGVDLYLPFQRHRPPARHQPHRRPQGAAGLAGLTAITGCARDEVDSAERLVTRLSGRGHARISPGTGPPPLALLLSCPCDIRGGGGEGGEALGSHWHDRAALANSGHSADHVSGSTHH